MPPRFVETRHPGIANLLIGAVAISGVPVAVRDSARWVALRLERAFSPVENRGILPGATLRLLQAAINPRRWRSTAFF
jgi:hypothetical protein